MGGDLSCFRSINMNEEKKEILYYRSGKDTLILHAV